MLRIFLLALPMVLMLSGCASAPATRFYALAPVSGATVDSVPRTLVVQEVTLPRYLDRPQLITRSDTHRLRLAEFDHWGGDLREELTRVLAANLAQRLPGSTVLPAPTFTAVAPDGRIAIEVLRFEAADDGQVHLQARWRSGNTQPPQEATFMRPRTGTATDAALVATLSALVGDLAQVIAQAIAQSITLNGQDQAR